MLKTELRFLLPTSTPTNGNSSQYKTGVYNSSFQYYTDGWSGDTMTTSSGDTYKSLYNDGTYQDISLIDGWEWYNGYMISLSGSNASIYQDLQNVEYDNYYQLSFTIKDFQGTGQVMPYLFGNECTGVTSSGRYVQTVYIATTEDNLLRFSPDASVTFGLTAIEVKAVGMNSELTIDMYDNESFNLTFQIQTTINNRASTYSKTMRLPGTKNNNKIFNNLFDLNNYITDFSSGSTNVFLNKKIRAGLYQDTIELVVGNFELNKVIIDNNKIEYEGIFYSTLKTIADELSDKLLTGNDDPNDDIDLSEWDHDFEMYNIYSTSAINLFTKDGYYYPFVDFSNITEGNKFRVENFKPCIFVPTIINKILEKSGFNLLSEFLTLQSSLFLVNDYGNLAILQGNERKKSDFIHSNTKFNVGLENTQYSYGFYNVSPFFTKINYNIVNGVFYNSNNTYNTSSLYYECTNTDSYTLTANINFIPSLSTAGNVSWYIHSKSDTNTIFTYLRISKLVNGVSVPIKTISTNTTLLKDTPFPSPYFASGWKSISLTIDNSDTEFNVGDIFIVEYGTKHDFEAKTVVGSNTVSSTSKTTIDGYVEGSTSYSFYSLIPVKSSYYRIGSKVYANDVLPQNVKQIDFLKAIFDRFNVMFTEDKSNPHNLICEPYDYFYYTGQTYVDWSRKLDTSKSINIERIPYLIDMDVNFIYQNDDNDKMTSDFLNIYGKGFGNKLVKNTYYTDSVEKIEDIFSSTMMTKLGSTDAIISRIYQDADEYLPTPQDWNYNSRLLLVKQQEFDGSINIMEYDKVLYTFNNFYMYGGHLDDPYNPTYDINWGNTPSYNGIQTTTNNTVWKYWRNKLSLYMNPNSKFVTCYIRINPSDISLLDFRRKILIDNNIYKLNRIIEWSPSNYSTKVELIQEAVLNVDSYITPEVWQVPSENPYFSKSNPNYINLQTPEPSVFYPENIIFSGGTSGVTIYETGYTYVKYQNEINKDSNSIVIGHGNKIYSGDNFISGDFNTISSSKSICLNSSNNIISESSDRSILIHSDNVTINSGLTNTILLNSSNVTVTETGKTYINDVDFDEVPTITYINNNYVTLAGNFTTIIKTGQTYSTNGEYIIGDNYNGTGRTITLSLSDKYNGKMLIIHDVYGNAATNNITVKDDDGGTVRVLNTDRLMRFFYTDGSNWYSN